MTLKQLRPLPPVVLEVEPTPDDVAHFAEYGYLVVERITTDEELQWLAELYEHIFDPAHAADRTAPIDRSHDTTERGEPGVSQAFMPEMTYPELLRTTYHRNARRFAARLLGVDESSISGWSHMIRKLPGGRAAPWHQDEAYWDPELRYHALGCWLPLHAVTEEMGAMQFIPGSHERGVLAHRPRDGDVALHLLEADGVDPTEAVSCPLPAGGATFHHQRTLHYTAPNTTDQPRLAWPTEFQVAPVRRELPRRFDWVDEWRAVSGATAPTSYVADGVLIPL